LPPARGSSGGGASRIRGDHGLRVRRKKLEQCGVEAFLIRGLGDAVPFAPELDPLDLLRKYYREQMQDLIYGALSR
jgi:hypothetical protein